MSRSSRSDRRRGRRGFTLAEAIVSLVILVLVMMVALTLLFSMKSFAERQQVSTVPRQSARRATDYVSYFLAAAADLNPDFGNPNAIQVWYTYGTTPTASDSLQASYNNLTSAQSSLGTPGTDVISVAVPVNPLRIPVQVWPGRATVGATMKLNYRRGCGSAPPYNNAANLAMFQAETGEHGTPKRSGLLTVTDAAGRWTYVEITSYVASDCAAANDEVVEVRINPSGDHVNPPGGFRDDLSAPPVMLSAGVDYVSFRHRVDPTTNVPALEQKVTGPDGGGTYRHGLFDPNTDNPGTAFVPIVENIEDFQIAYVFNDGAIFNSASQTLSTSNGGTSEGVPQQLPSETVSCPTFPRDIRCVQALRVTFVGRSLPMNLGTRNVTDWNLKLRPRAEDHAGATTPDTLATGIFDRYRQTTTLMIRNRALGW
ncbi:MAG: type II secretion system protein [Acidobacteria bacterium]|nr:MAG: type II secretion system protein [Acidobacteriota bacterium]MCE7957299.1 type II secretion system protein [Acidobacteria bacterium ACB2]